MQPHYSPTALPDSYKTPIQGNPAPKPSDPEHKITATVMFAKSAGPAEYELLDRFAHDHGLSAVRASERTVQVSGRQEDAEAAFDVALEHIILPGTNCRIRARQGHISVPAALEPHVVAVLGLDTRPVARPYVKRLPEDVAVSPDGKAGPLTAMQVAKEAYRFPTDVTGKGSTVAIIELGGGYTDSDMTTYFGEFGIPVPKIESVSVDGAMNSPGGDADAEVVMDAQIVGSVAPGADIAVYFAENTDAGFLNAILAAATDKTRNPCAISISWGSAEDNWTAQGRNAMDAAFEQCAELGIAVLAASGDNGASDGDTDGKLHVDYPASSPWVTGCGGTKLVLTSAGAIQSQSCWNETSNQEGAGGGGISAYYATPDYQKHLKLKGRAVPDISGCADPETGYRLFIDGQWVVEGGTSAVSPLFSGLVALLSEKRGKPVGFLNPILYAAPVATFWDVRLGGNNDGQGGFSAHKGYDPATGLGSIIGTRLEALLSTPKAA